MVSNQSLPPLSNASERFPSGASGLNFLVGYSVSLSVFGSNLEMKSSPKSEYQTLPSLSSTTSCGSVVGRTTSYSVTIAWVERPVGRGRGLSAYEQRYAGLNLMVARYSAILR